jgi:transposase
MNEETYVGLDVHKSVVVATALNAQGERLDQSKLGPTDAELTEYLGRLPGRKHVVLEACTVWEHYFDAALSTGASVVLSHPTKTRLIAEASLKSDKVDSESLATLLRLNAVPEAFPPMGKARDLRDLVRERLFYLSKQKSVRNHLYTYLLRKGIPYEERLLMKKRRRELLRELGLPIVNRGLDLLKDFDRETSILEEEIHRAFDESPDAQLLATIPGIGELTGITVAAFLCPIDRFENINQVSAYCGLCPTNHQSASVSYQGHLRPDCHSILRTVLVEASWNTRRYEPRGEVAKAGRRIARRKGAPRGAIASAHKLLKICYAVLRRGTPYQPHAPEPSGRRTLIAAS